jgi:hypothetical protein
MKNQKAILAGLALLMIGLTALVLGHLQAYQRLGEPGIKSRPLAGKINREILMPESPAGYASIILTNSEDALKRLPEDTSYRSRLYLAPDHYFMEINTVLMGRDRSSLHAPQICLTGQGWSLDNSVNQVEDIPMTQPVPYELQVNRLMASKQFKDEKGDLKMHRAIFLFWFVDADRLTTSEWKRKLWFVPHDLLTTGVLDRWAYISCFSACDPGQETATYERMKKTIADIVPEFQLVPHAPN